MSARPPEHLVHGFDGPVVILTGRVCSFLNRYAGLEEFRINNRGTDPELDAALQAMRYADQRWRSSATGTTQEPKPELPESSEWLSTTQVAALLWITSRGVRKAIAEKRLQAESVAGRWRISREALAHYKAVRRGA